MTLRPTNVSSAQREWDTAWLKRNASALLVPKEQSMTLIFISAIAVLWEVFITQLVRNVNCQEMPALQELSTTKQTKGAKLVPVELYMIQRQKSAELNAMLIQSMIKKHRHVKNVLKGQKSIRSIKIVILFALKVHPYMSSSRNV